MSTPGGRSTSVPMQLSPIADNAELMYRAMLADMSIVVLLLYIARSDLESGRLVHVLPQHRLPHRPLLLVYPNRKFLPTKARAFIGYMLAQTMKVEHSETHADRGLGEAV